MKVHGREYEIEVRVSHHFMGTHALPSRPEMHEHYWEVEFSVCGPLNPRTGMVCDMLVLSEFFKPYVLPLDGYNLHEFEDYQDKEGLVGLTATYPTCDTLAHYFLWKTIPDFKNDPRFADLRISQIKVSIYEPDKKEAWGHAIIRPKPGNEW
ncbi:MAG: 6-carboxytetrahydropterin synthase [Acidobacteriota bacterium]|nr:6-carboxytetrahydropterin synthase [Acidobacteriota bacterium]